MTLIYRKEGVVMKKKVAALTTLAVLSSPFVVDAASINYDVKKGDSLWSIARKFDTTVSQLKKLNNLQSDLIFPKQTLVVSNNATDPNNNGQSNNQTTEPVAAKTYTIVSGDTLIKIANQFGISLAELRVWNNIEGHLIYPGQVVKVSQPTSTNNNNNTQPSKNEKQNGNPPTSSTATTEYRIKSGDTLSHIALEFGLSVQQLKSMNNLSSDLIFAGQILSITKDDDYSTSNNSNHPNNNKTISNNLINNAKQLLGTPYLHAGTTPTGFDCSGFIYYVFNQSNIKIPRTSTDGYYSRSFYVNKPVPGDLVFFENTYRKGISHMGIYIGNNQFIHSENRGVIITNLNNSYYKQRFDGFKRFY